jgi:hypothetical protein
MAARERDEGDPSPSLSELAALIEAGHAARVEAARAELDRSVEVGRLLAGVRARFPDGGWPEWVAENCPFGIRQAQGYIQTYLHQQSARLRPASSRRKAGGR